MKILLQYKTFVSSDEFVKWQNDNPSYVVSSISPVALNMGMSVSGTDHAGDSEVKAGLEFGVFVVYFEEK